MIAVVLLVAAGLLAYDYYTGGELRLLPRDVAEEEVAVDRLQERFDQARRRLEEAARAASDSGQELTAEAEAARLEVERISTQLQARLDVMAKRAQKGSEKVLHRAREKADKLQAAIKAFMQELK